MNLSRNSLESAFYKVFIDQGNSLIRQIAVLPPSQHFILFVHEFMFMSLLYRFNSALFLHFFHSFTFFHSISKNFRLGNSFEKRWPAHIRQQLNRKCHIPLTQTENWRKSVKNHNNANDDSRSSRRCICSIANSSYNNDQRQATKIHTQTHTHTHTRITKFHLMSFPLEMSIIQNEIMQWMQCNGGQCQATYRQSFISILYAGKISLGVQVNATVRRI